MGKHEAPPFRLAVENGRLVPAAAWDAERLATYRNGSIVSARITQEKNRKLERKYWAILHRVIETCPVKQRDAEELHRAIRLKLGVVEAFFDISGKLRVDLKSTTGMEEPEYREFFEEAMRLLSSELGVDAQTLGAEAADVGEDEPESSDGHSADEPSERESSTALAEEPEPAAPEAQADPAATPAPVGLSDDDRAWLKLAGKMLWASTGPGEQDLLRRTYDAVREHHTPAEISRAARDRGMSIYKKCKLVCSGETPAEAALSEIAMSACCETREIAA